MIRLDPDLDVVVYDPFDGYQYFHGVQPFLVVIDLTGIICIGAVYQQGNKGSKAV